MECPTFPQLQGFVRLTNIARIPLHWLGESPRLTRGAATVARRRPAPGRVQRQSDCWPVTNHQTDPLSHFGPLTHASPDLGHSERLLVWAGPHRAVLPPELRNLTLAHRNHDGPNKGGTFLRRNPPTSPSPSGLNVRSTTQ